MSRKIILYSACVMAVFCALLATFYSMVYPSHLLWQEQNQIFLNSPGWIATYFSKPAWLGCLAGDWLTQFYHNPVTGAVILSLAITYCTVCIAIAAGRLLPRIASCVLTAIGALLLIACSMSASTTLAFFMCVAGGLTSGLIRIRIPAGNKRRIDISFLLVVAFYWAFGFGAIITVLMIVAFSLKSAGSHLRTGYWWISPLCAVILGALTPALLCESYALPYRKALTYPGIARMSLPDLRYEELLRISDEFYKGDYEKVKHLAMKTDNPNEVSAFYYYLSSALQDSLPDNLLRYGVKNLGTLTSIGDKSSLPVINMMNDLYYELGDMTYAERAAMMRNVFSPRNRNVRMICRLAEINLVSGDTLAALKYLRVLDRTHAYAEWSEKHRPGNTSPDIDKEIMRRRGFSNGMDNIRLGDNCRNILLELLESNHRNTVALDYLLCTDLLLKDMDTFKMDYDTYCMSKGSPRYKKLYQEALMIYLAGTEAPEEEWNRYIVPGPVADSFIQYSNRRGDPAFRDTYWYYFDK